MRVGDVGGQGGEDLLKHVTEISVALVELSFRAMEQFKQHLMK